MGLLIMACEGPPGPAGPPGPPGQSPDGGATFCCIVTGPGLKMEILSAQAALDGTVTTTFKLTDDAGVPLDMDGRRTQGAVSPRFVLSRLPPGALGPPGPYVPITTGVETTDAGQSALQPATDSDGTFSVENPNEGIYRYTFGTKAPQVETGETHTIGAFATREFEGQRYVANAVFHFVPAGGSPGPLREIVTTAACNGCHGTLLAHGGARREVSLCITCHTAGMADANTGNSIHFAVMGHKIHRGEDLPSVEAGNPYRIIGFRGSVNDYSDVVFPQDIRNCNTCHQGPQGEAWKTHPTRAACGSCHDLTAFTDPPPAGMTLHPGGAAADDAQCSACHPPSGGLSGVEDVHRLPTSPALELAIQNVTGTIPGGTPEVTFSVTVDAGPRDILTSPLSRLALVVAGPTVDYAGVKTATIQGSGAAGTLTAVDAASGVFRYTAPATVLPADASGTYAFSLEGYLQPDPSGPRFAALEPVAYSAVTDATALPRRQIVDIARCNRCHRELAAHGGQRKNPQACVLCHNANNTNDERVSRVEGETIFVPSVHFKHMIHRLHMGEELSQPYILYGFPAPSPTSPLGTPILFSELRFPGRQQDCGTCHLEGTFQLPLPAGLLPTREEELTCTEDPAADGDAFCDTRAVTDTFLLPPVTAACNSCHDSVSAAAHAMVNTTAAGAESCATCHGAQREFAVERAHKLAP